MRSARFAVFRPVIGVLALLAVGCEDTTRTEASKPVVEPVTAVQNPAANASGFDFWVLALSWSPGYCASEGDNANREQCAGRTEHAFVVHGLWPQFERGYPEFCETRQSLDVSRQAVNTIDDLIPSTGLVRHQWKKHGTCSGLTQPDYFETIRAAREMVAVPDDFEGRRATSSIDPDAIEAAFLAANPGLPAKGVAVTCDRRFLREVRICLNRDLSGFRPCAEIDTRSCRLGSVVVPPDDR